MRHRAHSALAIFAGAWLIGSPASAFRMNHLGTTVGTTLAASALVPCNDPRGFAHWGTTAIGWWLNTANQGAGAVAATQNALQTWTNVPTAGYVLSYNGTNAGGFALDGANTISWATTALCTGTCLGLTAITAQSVQVIVETDIVMNDSSTWSTTGAWGTFDIQAVLTHELGHSLGIHHTDVPFFPEPTMTAFYVGTDGRTLEQDDQDALACSFDRYHTCTSAPGTPAYIAGPGDLCPGEVGNYWTPAVTGADFYTWQAVGLPWTEFTIDNSFALSPFLLPPGTHTLRARVSNTCGNGNWQTRLVWMRDPFDPVCSCPGRGCP